jgi:hypothetical protein
MNQVILILDDSEERLEEMQSLIVESYPQYDIIHFDNAPDTIEWLEDNLTSVVLMSLDHDLGLNREREARVFDPGTGKDVVDFLETKSPVCPIIVHSSNYLGRDRMFFSLEAAGWRTSCVNPHDDLEWIFDAWMPQINKYLKNENIYEGISLKELKKILANGITQQELRELRFILRQRKPDDIFHALFWLTLRTDLHPTDYWASCLLVDLDPPCPISCKEALIAVAGSNLNLSNRLVPFYLVTQFGKGKVIKTYNELIANEFPNGAPETLKTIQYWLSTSSVDLVDNFITWRRKVIANDK